MSTKEIIERQIQRLYARMNGSSISNEELLAISITITNLSKLREKYDKEEQ